MVGVNIRVEILFLFCFSLVPVSSWCPTPSTVVTKHFIQQFFSNADTIDLSHCNLESIEDGAFSGQTSTTYLFLHSNKLTRISTATFEGLTNVYSIILDDNQLTEIMDKSFDALDKLRILQLRNNNLQVVTENTLKGISERLFIYNPYLSLDLSSNNYMQLHDNVFKHLFMLETLNLTNCGIRHIRANIFSGLVNLTTLYLSHNDIEIISDYIFQSMPNVGTLWLDNNKLKEVRRAMFSNSYRNLSISHLDLSSNNISYVEEYAFTNLNRLKTLIMSNNPLHKLDCNMFAGLVAIKQLYLKNCGIGYISEGSLQRLNTLQTLDLQNNKVTWLSEGLQNFACKQLNNQVQSYDWRLDLTGNPIQCNCDLNIIVTCYNQHHLMSNGICYYDSSPSLECNLPTPPQIIKQNYSSEANSAILECESTGDPVPKITWTTPNGNHIIHHPQKNHSILTNTARLIICLNNEAAFGEYICNASSNGGWLTNSYSLIKSANDGNQLKPPSMSSIQDGGSATSYWLCSTSITTKTPPQQCPSHANPQINKPPTTIEQSQDWMPTFPYTSNDDTATTRNAPLQGGTTLQQSDDEQPGTVVGAVIGIIVIVCIVVGGIFFYRFKKYGKILRRGDDNVNISLDIAT